MFLKTRLRLLLKMILVILLKNIFANGFVIFSKNDFVNGFENYFLNDFEDLVDNVFVFKDYFYSFSKNHIKHFDWIKDFFKGDFCSFCFEFLTFNL